MADIGLRLERMAGSGILARAGHLAGTSGNGITFAAPRPASDRGKAPRSERCSRLAPGGITGAKVPRYRLALLQGAIRRSSNFSTEVSETPRTISTITGTNVLSISNTLAYRVIMKPRPVMVV
jgi:hypothetical protein